MAFQFASTNLVVELGIILALLMGWQFTLAEFIGGPLMIVFLAAAASACFSPGRIVDDARQQADRGVLGSMEGHAADGHDASRRRRDGSSGSARRTGSPRPPTTS